MYNNMLFKTNPANTFTWFSSHCSIFPEDIVRAFREYERESFGTTREQGKWECHRNYVDIQYIAEGVEQIGVNHIDKMHVVTEYNPEKDVAILGGKGDYVTLSEGSYGIFFPEDAHQPKVAPDNIPGPVKKVVIKVKIDW